ncbi:MAG: hypothetical protein HY318_17680 [Armatimonadetes bacterium]|nr:hypothetical protein [Armatimonadota bacterium]
MNLARKIMWCLCLGVWLAAVLVVRWWGPALAADWQNHAIISRREASAANGNAPTPDDTAACLEDLRQAQNSFSVEEAARQCAAWRCKAGLPLLRRVYYEESVLYNGIWCGYMPFTSTFVAIRQLEGRPIQRLVSASDTLQASLLSPDHSLFLPSPAHFSRFTARQFILHCKDKEAAGYTAVLLARFNDKVPWGSRESIRNVGRDLLKELPREASQPLLERIRTGIGSDMPTEFRDAAMGHSVKEFDELHRICGAKPLKLLRSALSIFLLPFQFVFSLGLVYFCMVYLGVQCLADHRRQTAAAVQEEKPGPQSEKPWRGRVASCACLVAACWAPVVVRACVMLAIAHMGMHGNPYLEYANGYPVLDTMLALMVVSTPALICEGWISRRLRRREREAELGAE